MAKGWVSTNFPGEDWLACLYQCGFACYHCYQPIGAGMRDLGPVIFANDHEDSEGPEYREPYWVAACIECQRAIYDPFIIPNDFQMKGR